MNMVFLPFILFFVIFGNAKYHNDHTNTGGTQIQKFPYQVSLNKKGTHGCGGSIISEKHVVTAAHCIASVDVEDLTIRVGSSFYKLGGDIHNISAIFPHPRFNETTFDNDIGILVVDPPLWFNPKVGPVKVVEEELVMPAGTTAIVTGWGHMGDNSVLSHVLQKIEVPLINRRRCERFFEDETFTMNMICAGFPEGIHDVCKGDSGGPMVANGVLIGIVSWGFGCSGDNELGVYTNVANLRDFIYSTTGV